MEGDEASRVARGRVLKKGRPQLGLALRSVCSTLIVIYECNVFNDNDNDDDDDSREGDV